jgi:hypothetical protein
VPTLVELAIVAAIATVCVSVAVVQFGRTE